MHRALLFRKLRGINAAKRQSHPVAVNHAQDLGDLALLYQKVTEMFSGERTRLWYSPPSPYGNPGSQESTASQAAGKWAAAFAPRLSPRN